MRANLRLLPHVDARCDEWIAALDPTNPFFTSRYREARARLSWQPCLLMGDGDGGEVYCPAVLKSGVSGGWMEIPSLPTLRDPEGFWASFLEVCRANDIVMVDVASFGSQIAHIPRLSGERGRRRRWEYVLDLTSGRLWDHLSTNHARNIKRGWKGGLALRRSRQPEARARHVALMGQSMDRRKGRGEAVPDVHAHAAEIDAFVDTGAGELFQAVQGDRVVSSILVLLAREGGYYHSAGTSPDGMGLGASHFLVSEIAMALKHQGMRAFNLGGVSEEGSGLDQFKRGFGGRCVTLEAVQVSIPRRVARWLGAGVRMLREVAGVGGGR